MSTVRKTITVTGQQDQWIKAQVTSGNFTNDSEYIRDLLRRDQENNAEIQAIREALIKAEERGFSNRSPEDVRKAVQERLRQNGQLQTK